MYNWIRVCFTMCIIFCTTSLPDLTWKYPLSPLCITYIIIHSMYKGVFYKCVLFFFCTTSLSGLTCMTFSEMFSGRTLIYMFTTCLYSVKCSHFLFSSVSVDVWTGCNSLSSFRFYERRRWGSQAKSGSRPTHLWHDILW